MQQFQDKTETVPSQWSIDWPMYRATIVIETLYSLVRTIVGEWIGFYPRTWASAWYQSLTLLLCVFAGLLVIRLYLWVTHRKKR